MHTVPFSQIPKWNAEVASDVFPPLAASAVEWEANYLLPQLIGPTEHPSHAAHPSATPRLGLLALWRKRQDKPHPTTLS